MTKELCISLGILIPFLGTTLGSAMVFFLKDKLGDKSVKILLGFASGVMIAASIWSLLLPAMELAKDKGRWAFLPAAIGFLLGIGFLLLMDVLIPHLHLNSDEPEGKTNKKISKTTMMLFAVTIHNIPEGMAVGVVIAGAISGNAEITMMGAVATAIGIAIQNFPEGAIISMPLKGEGLSKKKAFFLGTLSGAVEPLGALLTLLLTQFMTSILPYLLSFAAGAMIYVVVEELIPEAQEGKHSNLSTISLAVGFVLMMVLDVTLG